MDRAGASFRSSVLSLLAGRLHPKPLVLALPVTSFDGHDYLRAEPGIAGIVDLVRWEVWRDDQLVRKLPNTRREIEESDIFTPNHPLLQEIIEARVSLLENLSMLSEQLLEDMLELPSRESYLSIPSSTIIPHLRALTVSGKILPVLCGSAAKHVGTKVLLNYVGELLASPLDIEAGIDISTANVQALAWKVVWDKRRGWMTFVRVYSGSLMPRLRIASGFG